MGIVYDTSHRLRGGIQSTACLALAAQGVLNYKDFVFSNVGQDSEYPATLAYVEQVAKPYAAAHGLNLIEVQKERRDGSVDTIYQRLTRPGSRSIGIPVRMNGNGAPGRRSCTYDFKIAVIDKWLRAQGAKTEGAQVGLGISLDEIGRMKPNMDPKTPWKQNVFPLLEEVKRPLSRQDCIAIIERAGLPVPPKSSCWFCPYHSLTRWQEMREQEPNLFSQAADLETFINERRAALGLDPVWFSSKLKPLVKVTTDYTRHELFDEQSWACESGYCFA